MREFTGWPAFVREIDVTLAVQSQYVLWGNLHDSFLVEPGSEGAPSRLLPLRELLWEALHASGYTCIVTYDPVDGLGVHPCQGEHAERATQAAEQLLHVAVHGQRPSLEGLAGHLAAVARPRSQVRAAVLIEYASRIARSPLDLEPAERDFFRFCEKLSRTALPLQVRGLRPAPLYNPVVWLVDRPGDLPPWLAGDNDMVREIALSRPDFGARQQTARVLARAFRDNRPQDAGRLGETVDRFAEQADGLTLRSMIEVTRLARDRGMTLTELPDAVRTYKLGVLDNPWRRDYVYRRIQEGEREVPARVVGQRQAVTKALDILKRAALGLSGAQRSRGASGPRGVLFFAGPTGVGKTELARAIAALVFGDESSYLRFDMSEFSAEHAGDRLIGAPPGYVGFDAGGELTNAVKQQPFRVILFDEIEKAHPRILDKFLQILEDGRLTDGRGQTVYFSEAILIFTSNLGTFVEDGHGRRVPNLDPAMPYEEIEHRVRQAVADHFTTVLNRPELLNRFGNNVVVFDFIDAPAADRIFSLLLDNVVRLVADEHATELVVPDGVRETLRAWCTADLGHGGRGIGNALEASLVNPLARALFALGDDRWPARIDVAGIVRDGDIVSMELG